MNSLCLDFQSVKKNYGSQKALKGVSFQIRQGEKVALLGCNGAGKSTAISLASGLRPTSAGQVSVFGHDPGTTEAQTRLRVLPQELDFPEYLKVKEVIEVVNKHFRDENIQEFAEALDIEKLMDRRCSALSGGERKKVGLLCTLLGSPSAILLDEPTANIDLQGRELIYDLLRRRFLHSPQNTFIFSSHQMQEVEQLANRILVLNKGTLVADGSPAEIRSKYGLKKVVVKTPVTELKLNQEFKTLIEGDKTLIFGENSDQILKSLYESSKYYEGVEVHDTSLDEIFLKLWTKEGVSP